MSYNCIKPNVGNFKTCLLIHDLKITHVASASDQIPQALLGLKENVARILSKSDH